MVLMSPMDPLFLVGRRFLMDLPALLLLWVHLSLMGQLFLVAHLCRMALRGL